MSKSIKNKKEEQHYYELYFLIISLIFIIPLSYCNKLMDTNLAIRLFELSLVCFVLSFMQKFSKHNLQISTLNNLTIVSYELDNKNKAIYHLNKTLDIFPNTSKHCIISQLYTKKAINTQNHILPICRVITNLINQRDITYLRRI